MVQSELRINSFICDGSSISTRGLCFYPLTIAQYGQPKQNEAMVVERKDATSVQDEESEQINSGIPKNSKLWKSKLTRWPRVQQLLKEPEHTWSEMSQRRMKNAPEWRRDAWRGMLFFTHCQHEQCGSLSEWRGFKTKKMPRRRGPVDKFVNVLCL